MSAIANSQVATIEHIQIVNPSDSLCVIVKFPSPASIPSVFSELKYAVPKEYNSLFNRFMPTPASKEFVVNYVHPIEVQFRIIFKQVRIIKNIIEGQVKPQFTIHLVPIKEDAFVSDMNNSITIQDFTEKSFSIILEKNTNTSKFNRWTKHVAIPFTIYNDKEVEKFLTPDNKQTILPLNEKDEFYSALGMDVISDNLQFRRLIFVGKIRNIRNHAKKNEEIMVDFYQVFPDYNQTLYDGGVGTINQAVRKCYSRKYGWHRDLMAQKMSILRDQYGLSSADELLRKMYAFFFGVRPQAMMRQFATLPNYTKQSETALPLKYINYNKWYIPSGRVLPLGGPLVMGGNSDIVKKAVKKINQQPSLNPFQCMASCANDDNCDFYNVVHTTCNMYSMTDEQAKKVGGNLDLYLNKLDVNQYRNNPKLVDNLKKQNIYIPDYRYKASIVNGKSYGKFANDELSKTVVNAWADIKRVKKDDLQRAMKYDETDRKFATMVQQTIELQKKEGTLDKNLELETFTTDNNTEVAIDSALQSYKTAYDQAQHTKKSLELASTQAEFGISQKIYYNLFTTALWIINIACLIGNSVYHFLWIYWNSDS